MHDPLTVAHEIRKPWFKYKPWPKKFRHKEDHRFIWEHRMTDAQKRGRDSHWPEGYRESFITIWHKDPERDGSDDSCGYTYPKLTDQQRERLRNAAWHEGQHSHFLACTGKEWDGTYAEAVSLYEGLVLFVCEVLRIKVSMDFIRRYAVGYIHRPDCCPRTGVFCFLPGYHTNNPKDSKEARQEHFTGILCGVARGVLYELRPWWKHPKWHIWHWRIQIPFLQQLKRVTIERCAKCGRRFSWNECVIGSWSGTQIWHDRCDDSAKVTLKGKEQ